jgi:hypothetical protein
MPELATIHPTGQATNDVAVAVRRARADFTELPGLQLTEAQARRLWSLDAALCAGVLSSLVADGFLVRTADARFARTCGQK